MIRLPKIDFTLLKSFQQHLRCFVFAAVGFFWAFLTIPTYELLVKLGLVRRWEDVPVDLSDKVCIVTGGAGGESFFIHHVLNVIIARRQRLHVRL